MNFKLYVCGFLLCTLSALLMDKTISHNTDFLREFVLCGVCLGGQFISLIALRRLHGQKTW